MDSLVGDLVAELVAEALEDMGMDGYDYDEVGRGPLRRKRQNKAVKAALRRAGISSPKHQSASATLAALAQSNPYAAQSMAHKAMQQAALTVAAETGNPQTVGNFLATSNQRKEVLHLGFATLAATAVTSTQNLTVNCQRALQAERLILSCADSTTGADQLFSVGVFNAVLGAHNLLSTPGVVGTATAYGANAFQADILSVALGQGGIVRIDFQRIATTTNPGVISGTIFGRSAQG